MGCKSKKLLVNGRFCYAVKRRKTKPLIIVMVWGALLQQQQQELKDTVFNAFLGSVIFLPKKQSYQQFLGRFALHLAFQGFCLEHWLSHPWNSNAIWGYLFSKPPPTVLFAWSMLSCDTSGHTCWHAQMVAILIPSLQGGAFSPSPLSLSSSWG